MKTKEEIEQLAEEFLTFHQEGSKVYHIKIREAIAFAYNKCQEDMQKDVEYWQGEFEQKEFELKAADHVLAEKEKEIELLTNKLNNL